MSAHKLDRWDFALCLGLSLGYLTLLLCTVKELGYARDEGFYFQAARSYEAWFELLRSDGSRALEPRTIDRYWSVNHEHPALMKALFALSHRYLWSGWQLFREQGTAYRFPAMVLSALGVACTYAWGKREFGRLAGLVAALSLALMPRVFFHSHLACFDMPVTALLLITSYAFARSLAGGLGWALATGVLYGLLLDTKHNAWLLPGAFALHFLLTRGRHALRELKARRWPIPHAFWAMLLLSPCVLYAGWPWIWHDTARRLSDYAQFHLRHDYYNMEFWGQTYWKPPMPRLYAWVMTLATVPGVTLLLFAIGLGAPAWRRVAALRARASVPLAAPALAPVSASASVASSSASVASSSASVASSSASVASSSASVASSSASVASTRLLWLLCLLLCYAPWWSAATPIFGGTKHWLTAYPFLCLFAGGGFAFAAQQLAALFARRCWATWAPAALAMTVLVGPLAMTLHSEPWGLSFYTPLVGGAPGAASLGLNRTFWGYTTGALRGFINQQAPPGGKVYIHDTALQSWEMLRADGRLRSDLQGTLAITGSALALYHHEPHMRRVEYQTWLEYGHAAPSAIGSFDGVPVVWVYTRQSSP